MMQTMRIYPGTSLTTVVGARVVVVCWSTRVVLGSTVVVVLGRGVGRSKRFTPVQGRKEHVGFPTKDERVLCATAIEPSNAAMAIAKRLE